MSHPKLLRVGAEGVALWLAGLCHCNAHATDGRIPKELASMLYPPLGAKAAAVVQRLVQVELWVEQGPEYLVHDYERYQGEALKSEVSAKQEEEAARKRYERERKRNYRQNKVKSLNGHSSVTAGVPLDVPVMSHGTIDGTSLGLSRPCPVRARDPGPSRPVPSRPEEAAAAAPGESELPVTSEEVADAWHRAMWLPDGNPNGLHALQNWRQDYETIAAAITALPWDTRRTGLTALFAWLWRAPEGPIVAGRLSRSRINPGDVAKRVTSDLAAAEAWFATTQNGASP